MDPLNAFSIPLLGALLLIVSCTVNSDGDRRNTNGSPIEPEEVRLVQLAEGLEEPWGITFLPDGQMLVTEKPGRLNLVGEDGTVTPVGGTPEVHTEGQGGLLDVALHPDYESNGWVYLTYSKPADDGQAVTALARGRLEDDELEEVEDLFESNDPQPPGRHYGSRLLFLDDGTLLMTIGERGQMELAQDPSSHNGSTLRLNDDGSAPEDNPAFDEEGAVPELYTIGNRNSQGMALHPETGEVWQNEHGPQGGDELNHIVAGENYGWPEATWGRDYGTGEQIGVTPDEAPEMTAPVEYWDPAIAPSGLTFYSGEEFPDWQNHLFMGSLTQDKIIRLELDGSEVVGEEDLIEGEIGRIRDVREGPDGFLYILNDEADGGVYRLEPDTE